MVAALPPDHVGRAVLDQTGRPFRGGPDELHTALPAGALRFHQGSIRGALPVFA